MTNEELHQRMDRTAQFQASVQHHVASLLPAPGERFVTAFQSGLLSLEHALSSLMLLNQGLFSSAIALTRPQFESLVRGVWLLHAASDNWAQLRAMLEEPEPVSVNEASERLGVDRKNLYLQANAEARAIADRYLRHRTARGEQRQTRLQSQIAEVLDERLAAGYEGMSARDIWHRLDTEAQSVPGIFRHITAVMDSRRS